MASYTISFLIDDGPTPFYDGPMMHAYLDVHLRWIDDIRSVPGASAACSNPVITAHAEQTVPGTTVPVDPVGRDKGGCY